MGPIRIGIHRNWERLGVVSILSFVFLLIGAWWLAGLYSGKRWMWWTTLIVNGSSLISIPWTVRRQGSGLDLELFYVQCVLAAVGLVLLLTASSRAWFGVLSPNKALERSRVG
jgi:phosphatidylglycerophosphate synthase